MSTRSQIVIKDDGDELWFYRHSDGYPTTNAVVLRQFLDYVKTGRIRRNVGQASGWLILMGAQEDQTYPTWENGTFKEMPKDLNTLKPTGEDRSGVGWKIGSYEPSIPRCHFDIEWFYVIDLISKNLYIQKVGERLAIKDDPTVELSEYEQNYRAYAHEPSFLTMKTRGDFKVPTLKTTAFNRSVN